MNFINTTKTGLCTCYTVFINKWWNKYSWPKILIHWRQSMNNKQMSIMSIHCSLFVIQFNKVKCLIFNEYSLWVLFENCLVAKTAMKHLQQKIDSLRWRITLYKLLFHRNFIILSVFRHYSWIVYSELLRQQFFAKMNLICVPFTTEKIFVFIQKPLWQNTMHSTQWKIFSQNTINTLYTHYLCSALISFFCRCFIVVRKWCVMGLKRIRWKCPVVYDDSKLSGILSFV